VRVPEAGDRALEPAAVAVRGVRVALLVGVRVVLAASEPRIASVYSTGLNVWNDRWVSSRWKPSVTP
jgi:hypothetical protein